MRISLFILLAFALFAQAAYAETKLAPKLTKITGYGEYKFGTPISQYDLSGFGDPIKDDIFGYDNYSVWSTFAVGGRPVRVYLSLCAMSGKLQAITLSAPRLKEDLCDLESVGAYMERLRKLYLDKYSTELIVKDDFAFSYQTESRAYEGVLWLEDKDGNTIKVLWNEYSLLFFYLSATYTKKAEGTADESNI